jgi:hypothetical protein
MKRNYCCKHKFQVQGGKILEIVTLDLWTLSHNMCVMIRNIYLKFKVDTLKSKEVKKL